MDDSELARRSIIGCGEMFAIFGRSLSGPQGEIRLPNAVGGRIDGDAYNPFFSSAVVPMDAEPPDDDPSLPHYLWTLADSVPGRVEELEAAMPCMGVDLQDPALKLARTSRDVEQPSLGVLGDINERAYGEEGFSPIARAVRDDRVGVFGLRDGKDFVCVAMTITVGDDLGIYYVATEESHRRQGLASSLVGTLMADARDRGLTSATLQSSEDGFPIWTRLGFNQVATLRGYHRMG